MRGRKVQNICHPGVVESQEGNMVLVRIESRSSCGNCQAKSYCGMVESEGRIIEVKSGRSEDFSPGQQVDIMLDTSLGYRALFLGYILPFLIMVSGLFLMHLISGDEALSALTAILLIVPYYYLLYRNRGSLRERFRFYIKPGSKSS